jgi:hypothetical protein
MDDDGLARMNEGQKKDRALEEFNQSTLDDVGPVGSQDQKMRVLGEIWELGEAQEHITRESVPTISVLLTGCRAKSQIL